MRRTRLTATIRIEDVYAVCNLLLNGKHGANVDTIQQKVIFRSRRFKEKLWIYLRRLLMPMRNEHLIDYGGKLYRFKINDATTADAIDQCPVLPGFECKAISVSEKVFQYGLEFIAVRRALVQCIQCVDAK